MKRHLLVVIGSSFILAGSSVLQSTIAPQTPRVAEPDTTRHRAVLQKYCLTCHNQRTNTGGLAFEKLDVSRPSESAELWEKVVRKLRTGQMPPAGMPRPDKATYDALASWLEQELDRSALANPNPGRPTLQRINRAEYTNAIRDLLGLEIDGAALLPADNTGYGFDNIGDVLSVSPALTERYLSAAAKISRLALGRVRGSPTPETFVVSSDLDQQGRVSEDLPLGSRGGLAVRHYFPAEGNYRVRIRLKRRTVGVPFGSFAEPHRLEVRLDGHKVRTFTIGGKKADAESQYDADTAAETDDPSEFTIPVKVGSRLLAVYFIQATSAPLEDLIEPSLRSKDPGQVRPAQPAIGSVTITGPYDVTGADDSVSRRRILVCRPRTAAEEFPCAKRIISTLARRAYRRPLTEKDVQDPLRLYTYGAGEGGFELGVEMALRGILVSPNFLFRLESEPKGIAPNGTYRLNDVNLASRLSFFLWSSIPDDELLNLAETGKLKDPAVLEQQVLRMLADPRSRALVTNFAAQWLDVRNVPNLRPSPETFLDFDENLRRAFQRETELFFESILRESRSVLDLLDADYTFVNDRLARHYGIPDVYGDQFRRITLPETSVRRGLLGHGSILTATSHPGRTSPVKRGKWILENIFGTPPPAPPPDVPDLMERSTDGKILPMRERLAQHRKNPACAGCHAPMDPLGFALENFDAAGKWRTTDESDTPIDASGTLPDGATFRGPVELRREMKNRSEDFVLTLTHKLLTYALGRGLEYYDIPAIRQIKRAAASSNYRFSSLVVGIVKSPPFQMRRSRDAATAATAAAANE